VIWYRHWLELRRPAAALLALALFGGFFYASSLAAEIAGVQARHELRRGIARSFAPLLAELTPTQATVVAVHAQSTIYLILAAFLILAGNGLRVVQFQATGGWDSGATLPVRSAVYTLSLPLSRTRLIATRAAAGYAASVVFFAASLVVHRIAISWAGHDVPLLPMLMISIFATVVTLVWSAALGLLTWILGPTFGMFVTLIAALVGNFAVYSFMGELSMRPSALWQVAPLMLSMVAGVVYVTARVVADEEF
jgi:hypothetical protein